MMTVMTASWPYRTRQGNRVSNFEEEDDTSELAAVVFIAMTDLRLENDRNESQSKSESPRAGSVVIVPSQAQALS